MWPPMQDDQLQFFFLPNRLPVRGLRPWQAFLLRQASLSRRRSLAISSILTYYNLLYTRGGAFLRTLIAERRLRDGGPDVKALCFG